MPLVRSAKLCHPCCVANARIAAIAFTVLSATLVAQQAPTGRLTVRVTDQTGTVIPGAGISVDPTSFGFPSSIKTDTQGSVVLDVPTGSHILEVTAQGFATSRVNADWREDYQSITVVLIVSNSGCGVCVTVEGPRIPLEPVELADLIPLIPLHTLQSIQARAHRSRP